MTPLDKLPDKVNVRESHVSDYIQPQSQPTFQQEYQECIQDQTREMGQQKSINQLKICKKCQREGHSRKQCVNGAFCTICRKDGHQNRSHRKHMVKQAQFRPKDDPSGPVHHADRWPALNTLQIQNILE